MPWIQLLLRLVIFAAASLFILGICFAAGYGLWRGLKVNAARTHTLRLVNQGNCRSQFILTADSPEPSLSFEFLLNNVPLAQAFAPAGEAAEEPAPLPAAQPGTAAPQPSAGISAAANAGQGVSSAAGGVASLLGGLGALIPGQAGQVLKDQASAARNVQVSTLRASRAPAAIQRQVQSLGGRRRALSGTPGALVVGQKISRPVSDRAVSVQTPDVEPGASLSVSLRVDSRLRRYPAGSFPYMLHVRQEASDESGVEANEFIRSGTAHFKPVAFWRYWLRGFSLILLALLGVSAFLFTALSIWF